MSALPPDVAAALVEFQGQAGITDEQRREGEEQFLWAEAHLLASRAAYDGARLVEAERRAHNAAHSKAVAAQRRRDP